jgi:hypothetical protein
VYNFQKFWTSSDVEDNVERDISMPYSNAFSYASGLQETCCPCSSHDSGQMLRNSRSVRLGKLKKFYDRPVVDRQLEVL